MGYFQIEITDSARREIRQLPGNMRQLIFREIQSLARETKPYSSKILRSTKDFRVPAGLEIRRIRIEQWRIVYVIEKELDLVTVLAVRKRPPYQYDDLTSLLRDI